jgi:hypothetical protein
MKTLPTGNTKAEKIGKVFGSLKDNRTQTNFIEFAFYEFGKELGLVGSLFCDLYFN